MPKEYRIPSIKKVVTVLSVLWPLACAAMFWTEHYSTRSLTVFFSTLAAVPVGVMWVLLLVSRHLDKKTAFRKAGRGRKAGAGAKKA